MGSYSGPGVVNNGLVFYFDEKNAKSFVGGPVTNTLPSPQLNGYPTTGNNWGTYNTNQYNGGNYFSIGTIASVSSNIITTTTAHPLRNYDAVTPQTTGGGVTAGVNYLVKKISSTSFSLHAYNSSEDGSQGYINPSTGTFKVYDDWANDVRISVNSSSFPTMWWGYPHLPNSALVKELIPKGFNGIPGVSTDCLRLHFHRTDATDGLAYGPYAAVTAGNSWTASFWTRTVTQNAVGLVCSFQIYNYGTTTPTNPVWNFTLGPLGEWIKHSFTFTASNPLAISYWFTGAGGCKFDIANIQYEIGTIANNFAPGTRTKTQAILDLTRNTTINAESLTYTSNGTFSFNGSTDYIDTGKTATQFGIYNAPYTMIAVFKVPNVTGDKFIFGTDQQALRQGLHHGVRNNTFYFGHYAADVSGGTVVADTWYHGAWVWSSTSPNARIYINGVLVGSLDVGAFIGTTNIFIGRAFTASQNIDTDVVSIYNRALSESEIRRNFEALRGRYNI